MVVKLAVNLYFITISGLSEIGILLMRSEVKKIVVIDDLSSNINGWKMKSLIVP